MGGVITMTAVQPSNSSSVGVGERVLTLVWGVLLLVGGLYFIAQPVRSAEFWILGLGLVWLVTGILDAFDAVARRHAYWGLKLVGAIIGILAGLYIVMNPLLGGFFVIATALIFLAISAIFDGIMSIFMGFRGVNGRRWSVIILGVLQLLIGVWLLLNPIPGMLSLIVLFGVALIVGGVLVIFMAFSGR